MFKSDGMFTLKERYKFLYHCVRAGSWYENNQNTDSKPWGGISDSADRGRFVYEYKLPDFSARAIGVWGQATGIMGLLALHDRTGEKHYHDRAMLAAGYMNSLQYLDSRKKKSFGGFREQTPLDSWSFPRDAATGAFGLCALYKKTGREEFLERARLFADWWIKYGTDDNALPYITFDLDKEEGSNKFMTSPGEEEKNEDMIKDSRQAGSTLFLYYLYKITGEKKYIDEAMIPVLENVLKIYKRNPPGRFKEGFHGEVEVPAGKDDFALTALMAGYLATKEKKFIDTAYERVKGLLNVMDEDGSFPAFGGTFISSIEMANFVELCEYENLPYDISEIKSSLRKSALFGLTLQETSNTDRRMFGGLYGQCHFGEGKNWIHHRSTAYSIALYLRLEGKIEMPYLHCLHWQD
ncbi:MAG: hypothetical protein ACLFQK_06445 [Fibrobacterota bacterium]